MLVTDCYNTLNMLIKLKIMRESNSKQLSRYNLLNASYKTTSAAQVTTKAYSNYWPPAGLTQY